MIIWTIIVANTLFCVLLAIKIFKVKEIIVKETIIREVEVEVEKIVFKTPDYLLKNTQVLFKMPQFSINEKDIFNLVRSIQDDRNKWSFSLSQFYGDSFYIERTTNQNKRIQLYIDGLSKDDDKYISVRMLLPVPMTFDKKWNDTFKHLLWNDFREAYNKKVTAEFDKNAELSNDISDLLTKTQKRDDTLNKLI